MFRLGVLIALSIVVFISKVGLAGLPNDGVASNVATGCLWRGHLFDVSLGTEPRRGVCPRHAKTITFPIQPPAGDGDGGAVLRSHTFHTALRSDEQDDFVTLLQIPTADSSISVVAACISSPLGGESEIISSTATLIIEGDVSILIDQDGNLLFGQDLAAQVTLLSPDNHDVTARSYVLKVATLGLGRLEHWLRVEVFITVHQQGPSPATCSFSGKAELFSAAGEN